MPSQSSLNNYQLISYQRTVNPGKSVEIFDIRLGDTNNLWVKLDSGDFITFVADGIQTGPSGKLTSAFGGLTLSAGPTDWFQLLGAVSGNSYRVFLRITNRGTGSMKFSVGIDCTQISTSPGA